VTKFTADYDDFEVDLVVASNFSWAEAYSRYNYILSTENWIRLFYGAAEAIDEGNIRINSDIVSIKFDNMTTTNVFQNDNVRIFRSDWEYPVKNPTTWWWGIDLVRRQQVYTVSVWGSGLTPSESATLSKIDLIKPDLTIINDWVKRASLIIPHTTDLS
jgi:hypothetical protein